VKLPPAPRERRREEDRSMKRTTVDLEDNPTAQAVAGEQDAHLKILERALSCRVTQRGTILILEGEEKSVDKAAAAVGELVSVIRGGRPLNAAMVESLTEIAVSPKGKAAEVYGDIVWSHRGRQVGPRTVNQKAYVDAIRANTITFAIGPAGTGKTYLAVAMAISALMAKRVARIILTRPAVEAGERLGFLPGTLQEKVDPYLRPLYDALYDMLDSERVEKLLERNVIEIAPIAFMRGRTLNDSFIILDEAQNSTAEQMKMVLTRQGFNSKMVVNGDVTQIDLPTGRRSGLLEAVDVVKGIEGISFVQFDERDVVRHSLVQRIVKAYERYNETVGAGRQLTLKLAEPDAAAGEVVVEIAYSALCGSELHAYHADGQQQGNSGHEAVGTVVKLGEGVSNVKIGQRVGVSAIAGCGNCAYCAKGQYTWCPKLKFYGSMHAERFLAAAHACHPLPEDVSWEAGVLLTGDGLGVPYHTSTKIASPEIQTVAVFGVGPMGQGSVLLQAHLGRRVIAVDISPTRLAMAKHLGASDVVHSKEVDPVAQVRSLTGGVGADAKGDQNFHKGVQRMIDKIAVSWPFYFAITRQRTV